MQCYFCSRAQKDVDYKDVETLRKFTSSQAKIKPPRKTGMCAKHQRLLARAVKHARYLALLPFTMR